MKKYFDLLKNSKLFSCMSTSDLNEILECLDAKQKIFKKNTYIINSGEYISNLMFILFGYYQIR